MDLSSPQSIIFFLCFFLLVLPLYLLYFISKHEPSSNTATNGGLRAYPVVGHLHQFIQNRHRFLDWMTEVLKASHTNTIILCRVGNIRGVITANPAVVEHVLKTGFDNFHKGPRFISNLHDLLGHGIFNSDGELWRVQRKTASFEFNTKSLRNFVINSVQHEISARMLPLLTKSSRIGSVIDLQDVLERFGFDSVCKVAFGVDPACLANKPEEGGNRLSTGFAEAFRDAAELSAGRFRYAIPRLWKIKKVFNMGSERRLQQSIATVHDFALEIIRSRKKESESSSRPRSDDLLSRFIANGDSSEEYLRDIVISFILAGRESTSSALTWFFWLLSSRPHVEAKIMEEIGSVRSSFNNYVGECFDLDELKEMHYLHAAISESMRLYPPVPVNNLACKADAVLPDGTEIKKGWFMSYISYAMGRMESVWGEDCNEYKPERWLDEAGMFKPESHFKYPVFHAGPRVCLGKEMAYIQMKSIAACLLERFQVEVVDPSSRPEQILSLTLRMKGGLPVRVKDRRVAGRE